jgi:enolase
MEIKNIKAMQILDSRGNPTVQVELELKTGEIGRFRVPSGASTGIHEACELRDNKENYFHGKSVENAVKNANNLNSELSGKSFSQEELDEKLIELDGTENKTNIGANAILGISVAFSKACAKFYKLDLHEYLYKLVNDIEPSEKIEDYKQNVHLFSNVINGGMHAGNALNIQEFMIIGLFETVQENVRATSEIYHHLKKLISDKYGSDNTSVGDEGGFAPNIKSTEEAFDLLVEAIEVSGYTGKVALATDCAASDFYNKETKKYEVEEGMHLDYKELTDYYNKLIEKYPIISIEDPMDEDDFDGWNYFLKNDKKLDKENPLTGNKDVLIVGDDLLVTNVKRIKMSQEKELCNALLLKINQIGTLTESIAAHKMMFNSNSHTIVSHRSGETSDDFISDLATAMRSSIKLGAPARSDRVAKYNRLLEIFNN